MNNLNILSKAIDEIKYNIPWQILVETFKDDNANWRHTPVSIDTMILTTVIRPRVMIDASLVGGQTQIVSLEGLLPEIIDNYNTVYQVPKERTQNRSIMSVLEVGYLPQNMSYGGYAGGSYGGMSMTPGNDVTNVARRIGDAVSSAPAISNAFVELIGENTVLIRDQYRLTASYFLRCILGNDENLNNINPRSYLAFSKLCLLAVKSYIYNKMIVKMDQAFLQGGQSLGSFKEAVERYSDAEELYQTHLREVWGKVSMMNDVFAHQRFLKLQMSGGL